MTVTRRRFLGGSAALAASALAAASPPPLMAAPGSCPVTPLAPLEVLVLNRMGYGPRPGDAAAFTALGNSAEARLAAYVEQQLNPQAIDDSACAARIAAARLKIRYGSVNEVRPLALLTAVTPNLWTRVKNTMLEWPERIRPYNEVRVATWLRAVYSQRQLFEVAVDFWHNHFNVDARSDAAIATTWPVYDREVIRAHALGNFRTMLEAVAKSTAMMYYLDNASNRVAGGEGGNENFARELFELHTLGSDNYLKFYNDRSTIGTVSYGNETFVRGYIDDDVYEASYALTGWTIKNGHWERPALNDGSFLFDPAWHMPGGKRVLVRTLAEIIENKADPIQEGLTVLDRVAYHVGTARNICTKLCRRFVADEPPATLVERAVAEWMAQRRAPDQIARVLRVILLSAEFQASWGQKFKRPLEMIWAYLRATKAELPVDAVQVDGDPNQGGFWDALFARADMTGQTLFGWGPPTGHPDLASYWANTNSLLQRWNYPFTCIQRWGGGVVIDLTGQSDLARASCMEIVDSWIGRLCGYPISAATRSELIAFMARGGDPNLPPQPVKGAPDWGDPKALADRLQGMVQLLAASPDYQLR